MRVLSLSRVFVWLAALSSIASVATGAQAVFPSPEEAAAALIEAVEMGNYPLVLHIAGPQMAGFWDSGDPLRDALERDVFLEAARRRGIKTDAGTADRRMLYVGGMSQPFPAPLIKTGSGWRFDADAGSIELTARRIRRNESVVAELCGRFLEAEVTYVERAYGGTPVFAQRIRSTPGQHDGLFWSGGEGEEDESPLGPVFADAAYGEQPSGAELRPLFGYFFRILPAQESYARARAGFTLIAWPAEYGVGGLRSFLITNSGELYQRDLGADGGRLAGSISALDAAGWSRVGDESTAERKDGK